MAVRITGKLDCDASVVTPANPPWNPRALWNRFTPDVDWRWVSGNHWTMFHTHFEDSARTLGEALHDLPGRQ